LFVCSQSGTQLRTHGGACWLATWLVGWLIDGRAIDRDGLNVMDSSISQEQMLT